METEKKPLIILTGPTAVGKTDLSIALAKAVNGAVISADSMQVYRYMDIGSAKISKKEMQGVPHYLVDEFMPDEEFNVVKFQEYAKRYLKEIYEKGQIPILVGGTGFYIQAVLYDIDFTSEREDTAYREQLEQLAKEHGAEYPSASLKDGGAATIDDFCTIILEEANAEGVRGEVVFEQAMLETGWLQYGGDSGISQYNFAGIGTTGGGVAGVSYPDVRTGIRAQVQHLKAYACEDALNQDLVDTRFDMVTRGSAPYVEWLGQQENPNGGGWAAGSNYGEKLRQLLSDLKAE